MKREPPGWNVTSSGKKLPQSMTIKLETKIIGFKSLPKRSSSGLIASIDWRLKSLGDFDNSGGGLNANNQRLEFGKVSLKNCKTSFV